jgi:hypothetical protein
MSIVRGYLTLATLLFLSFGASICDAQDLSTYRGFRLGADTQEIGQHLGSQTTDLRVIHQRPVVIEDLDWTVRQSSGAPLAAESLSGIKFSFYDHQLFRMVVTYDSRTTEGLTDDDVIEAISVQYGKAAALKGVVDVAPLDALFPDNRNAVAVWQSPEYSYTLVKAAYSRTYGLIIVSKARAELAKTAAEQSVRLDKIEAPDKAFELQRKQDADRIDADAKARLANKPNFRP